MRYLYYDADHVPYFSFHLISVVGRLYLASTIFDDIKLQNRYNQLYFHKIGLLTLAERLHDLLLPRIFIDT